LAERGAASAGVEAGRWQGGSDRRRARAAQAASPAPCCLVGHNAMFMRGSRRSVYRIGIMATMKCSVLALLAMLVVGATGHETSAAEHRCLNPEQRRAAVAGRQAVPLTKAIHLAKSRLKGDI